MASPAVQTTHSVQFLIDFKNLHNTRECFSTFMSRERNYDICMINALQYALSQRDILIKDSITFSSVINRIQSLATNHLVNQKLMEPGRFSGHNYFGLGSVNTTDKRGMEDLIENIWIRNLKLVLKIIDSTNKVEYSLYNHVLISAPLGINENINVIFTKQNLSIGESLANIKEILMPLAERRINHHNVRSNIGISLHNLASKKVRHKVLLVRLSKYFEEMIQAKSDRAKLECICLLMRDLLQIHLFADGNGRTIFLLANLLCLQNNLAPFYPDNICIFDANAIETMVTKMIEGQERFKELFIDIDWLSQELAEYVVKINELESLIVQSNTGYLPHLFHCRNFSFIRSFLSESEVDQKILAFITMNEAIFNVN